MKIALVYPPTSDPTAPYLSVPMLTGFLRAHGVTVLPIDANIEAFDELLAPGPLFAVRDRVEGRLAELEARPVLHHTEQLAYAALWRARGDAHAAPAGIVAAKAILRDPGRFYQADPYGAAVNTIEAALRAVSAAYAPLHLDFTAYRTPFALTTAEEIAADAAPDRDPFDAYVTGTLIPRLLAEKPDAVGISVCFPGQLQPAYAFGLKLRRALPGVHLTVGGPAMTQMLIRLKGHDLARALGPFDSAVVFEGENTLLALLRALDEGRPLRELGNLVIRDGLLGARYLPAHGMEDLKQLPAPDFDGMPLSRYLSPALILPYDPTRGCYWGKCTFCHYGLAEVGTASYREREVPAMIEHLRALSEHHGTRRFYLSQDSVAPKTLLKLAQGLIDAGLGLRWATDLKPEKYLTQERAQVLKDAGALACALGVESASPRVLSLIDKGAPVETVREVIGRLSRAGVAVEAMCFTDFPSETGPEALATLRFLGELRQDVALFIVGSFDLTHGALVAQEPARFGLREVWQLDGDHFGTGLFYEETRPGKRAADQARVEKALDQLSQDWRLRHYPWAGAISTAHTLLYYERYGKGAFRQLAQRAASQHVLGPGGDRVRSAAARFDLREAAAAEEREGDIWHELVYRRRHVSRAAYRELAAGAPVLSPRPRRYRYQAGAEPSAAEAAKKQTQKKTGAGRKTLGRRPSGAPNSANSPHSND